MLMAISRRSYKLHYETSQSEVFASKTAENLLRVMGAGVKYLYHK